MATVFTGRGAPPPTLGADGTWYVDLPLMAVHGPKTAGVWPSGRSIVALASAPTVIDLSNDLPLAAESGATLTTESGDALTGDAPHT